MSDSRKITFNRNKESEFYSVVKQRVNDYFVSNNISRHANGAMITKTIIILVAYAATYFMLLSNFFSPWVMLLIAMLHGFLTAMIGLNIAHDAIHGAYSSAKGINQRLGALFNFIGANDYVWKLTHNFAHHTYTNVPDHDGDIDQVPVLRLNPNQDLWWIHRFQHIYGVFLYSLSSISWVFIKDYVKFFTMSHGSQKSRHPRKEYLRLFVYKAIYYTIFLVIPLIVIDLAWWQILFGFFMAHAVEGVTLSFVFQLAHVVEGTEYLEANEEGQLENSWAIHQMMTTSDFAQKNPLANYLFGGLNFQIEHHLFPSVCHIHYHKIAPIIEGAAREYGLPYHNIPTYTGAVRSHLTSLKKMGAA